MLPNEALESSAKVLMHSISSSAGSSCSTAFTGTPWNREVMVLIPAECRAFYLSILSNVSLNWSPEDVQHCCFSSKKRLFTLGQNKLNKHSLESLKM